MATAAARSDTCDVKHGMQVAGSHRQSASCCAAPARPNVDPLRNDLRFQKLAASQEQSKQSRVD